MRKFNIDGYGIVLKKEMYSYNDSIALVAMIDNENGVPWEQFDTLTVCLGWPAPDEGCAYIDSNSGVDYEAFLEDNELAFPTGRWSQSGFCKYREFEFIDDIVQLQDGQYL